MAEKSVSCVICLYVTDNTTYRFGGKILDYINNNFTEHKSIKNTGEIFEYSVESEECDRKILEIIENILNKNYKPSQILVLFDYTCSLISKIQSALIKYGIHQKIWTENNEIIDGLWDINNFLMSQSDFFRAKIIQGPFIFLKEPDFFNLCQNKEQFREFKKEFFEQIINNANNATQTLDFLLSQQIFCTEINKLLLQELYKYSMNFISFSDFIFNIPESIKITSPGLNFSTVHSAKGLESDIVVVIKYPKKKENLHLNLSPFFFFQNSKIAFTDEILNQQKKMKNETIKNLNYVAATRAKE